MVGSFFLEGGGVRYNQDFNSTIALHKTCMSSSFCGVYTLVDSQKIMYNVTQYVIANDKIFEQNDERLCSLSKIQKLNINLLVY